MAKQSSAASLLIDLPANRIVVSILSQSQAVSIAGDGSTGSGASPSILGESPQDLKQLEAALSQLT